jgi:hypothetical protein
MSSLEVSVSDEIQIKDEAKAKTTSEYRCPSTPFSAMTSTSSLKMMQ